MIAENGNAEENDMDLKIKENKTTEFIAGLLMFIGGVYLLMKHVYVSSSFFTHGLKVGGIYVRSGICVLPFVAAAICLFLSPEKLWPKVFAGLSFVFIVLVATLSVNVRVSRVSLMNWIIILVLIFGGIVLILRAVYLRKKKRN